MDTLVHRFTLILTSCTQYMRAETAALIHVVRLLVGKVTKASADFKIFANLICTYFQNLSNPSIGGFVQEASGIHTSRRASAEWGKSNTDAPARVYTEVLHFYLQPSANLPSAFSLSTFNRRIYFQHLSFPAIYRSQHSTWPFAHLLQTTNHQPCRPHVSDPRTHVSSKASKRKAIAAEG